MKTKTILAALALCAGLLTANAAWLIAPPVFTVYVFDGQRAYVVYEGADSDLAHRIHWGLIAVGVPTGLIAKEVPLAEE